MQEDYMADYGVLISEQLSKLLSSCCGCAGLQGWPQDAQFSNFQNFYPRLWMCRNTRPATRHSTEQLSELISTRLRLCGAAWQAAGFSAQSNSHNFYLQAMTVLGCEAATRGLAQTSSQYSYPSSRGRVLLHGWPHVQLRVTL